MVHQLLLKPSQRILDLDSKFGEDGFGLIKGFALWRESVEACDKRIKANSSIAHYA